VADSIHQGNSPAAARLQLLQQRFARAARSHYAALETVDAEQADTQARLLAALHVALVKSGEQGVEKLLEMVNSSDPVVAGMAAVYAIRHDSEGCLATLRRVAQEEGLLGFRAGVALERWESGEWND
jgi:thioredoxin-like negative regulator of GroEL